MLLPDLITIITGQGHRSGPEGPVLKTEVPIFLQDKFGLEVEEDENNLGILLLKKDTLQKWSESSGVWKDLGKRKKLQSALLQKLPDSWTTQECVLVGTIFGDVTR